MSHPAIDMGKIAVQKALELIESAGLNPVIKNQIIELDTKVIVRASSKRK